MSKSSEQYHIITQLEPDLLIRGNYKRFGEEKPAFKERWDAIDKIRAELGEEKFREKLAEDAKDKERLREYLKDEL